MFSPVYSSRLQKGKCAGQGPRIPPSLLRLYCKFMIIVVCLCKLWVPHSYREVLHSKYISLLYNKTAIPL